MKSSFGLTHIGGGGSIVGGKISTSNRKVQYGSRDLQLSWYLPCLLTTGRVLQFQTPQHSALFSEGWGDPFLKPFFQPLEDYLTNAEDPEQESEYLEQFLDSEQLNQRTNDDKTILLDISNGTTIKVQRTSVQNVFPKDTLKKLI